MAQLTLQDGRNITFPDGLAPDQVKKIVTAASQTRPSTRGPWNDFQKSHSTTITAQSADGVLHQFPEGTDRAVIDKVMKDYAMQKSGPSGNPDVAVPWYTPIISAPSNAADVASGLFSAIRHPLDTFSGLTDLTAWTALKGLNYVAPSTFPLNDYGKKLTDTAGAVGTQIKDNFSTPTRAWNTVATHPIDTLMTVAPGIGQAGKIADAAGLANTASALAKAAEFANPVSLVGKVAPPVGKFVGRMAAYPLAATTGESAKAIHLAASTGMDGGSAAEAFRGDMRVIVSPTDAVNDAKAGVGNMARSRSAAYDEGMQATANSSAVVDTQPIRQKLDELRQSLYVQPEQTIGDNTGAFSPLQKASGGDVGVLDKIDGLLSQWESHPEGQTPLAMDALKQRLDEFQPAFGNPALDNQRRIVTAMQNSIKNEISAVEPSYADAMANYSASKTQQTEIQKTLGLGRRASVDTSLNKLAAALKGTRPNQAANLADLEANGVPNLSARLAGQALSNLTPKGDLARKIAAVIAGSGWFNPMHLAALPLSSPRFVGEAAHAAGRLSRRAGALLQNFNPNDPRLLQAMVAAKLSQGAQQ